LRELSSTFETTVGISWTAVSAITNSLPWNVCDRQKFLLMKYVRSARVGPCLQLIGGFDLGAIDRGSSASAQSRKPSE
jgi:hypothetical protein